MADRVTQAIPEAVVAPTGELSRVTQLTTEAVVSPTSELARVTQAVTEAVIVPNAVVHVTQTVWEVLYVMVDTSVRLPAGMAPLISIRAGSPINRIAAGSPQKQSA